MSDTVWIAVIASIPPTVAGIATLVVGIINSSKANKIHVLVNSNLSKVQANLAIAEARILALEDLISKGAVK